MKKRLWDLAFRAVAALACVVGVGVGQSDGMYIYQYDWIQPSAAGDQCFNASKYYIFSADSNDPSFAQLKGWISDDTPYAGWSYSQATFNSETDLDKSGYLIANGDVECPSHYGNNDGYGVQGSYGVVWKNSAGTAIQNMSFNCLIYGPTHAACGDEE